MSQKELSPNEHQCLGFGEVAGGTAAEFAAVCCCPCALVHLAAMAFVKFPAGLCKKTLKKIRTMKAKKRVQDKPANDKEEIEREENFSVASSGEESLSPSDACDLGKVQIVVARLSTEECWEVVMGKSYVGFWRNYSLRE